MPGVMPGQAGRQAWAGVLMPSVDRVGRYFPFTLAQPLAAGPATAAQTQGLWSWLARLDELARDALFDDWTAERLEQELARLPAHGVAPQPRAPAAGKAPLEEAADLTDATAHIAVEAQRAWAAQAQGRAWWQARPDDAPARLLLSRGLPAAHAMPRLFGPAATIAASAHRRRP
jgi:type VI secretion system protein ImpM